MKITSKNKKIILNALSYNLLISPLSEKEAIKAVSEELRKFDTWINDLKTGKSFFCMVGDKKDELTLLEKVIDFKDGADYPFIAYDENYKYARPATIEDLKDYLLEV